MTPSPRGWSSGATGSSRRRSCPAASFTSPADFNGQFTDWLDDGRTTGLVRTLKARPVDCVDADRAAMLALPPVPPMVGWSNQIRLGRDYYVRVDTNDYSVDPPTIGRLVERHTPISSGSLFECDRRVVADHAGSGPGG